MNVARTTLALALLFALGCGGDDTTGPGPDPDDGSGEDFRLSATTLDVTVSVPPNTDAPEVWTSNGTTSVSATATTPVTVFNGGPQFADVRDADGRLVLAGFLSDTQTSLDATSTAEALVFVALGGLAQVDEGAATILTGVRQLDGFADAVAAVESHLASFGFIDLTVGNLATAIEAVAAPVRTSRLARGTIATPTSASGVFLDTIVDGELKITNNYLRRVKAYLQRTGYVDAQGNRVDERGPMQEFRLGTPSRYGGLTGTIGGIVTGDLTWTPVTTGPYAIPLFPGDALETNYRLTTVGLGAGSGQFDALDADQEADYPNLAIESLVLDAIVPAVANILIPLKGNAIDAFLKFDGLAPVIQDLVNNAATTVPAIVGDVNGGDWQTARQRLWDAGWTSSTALPALVNVAIAFAEQYGSDALIQQLPNAAQRLTALGFVDIFFASADMAIYGSDVLRSDRANVFEITVTEGKVTLIPARTLLCAFDETTVRAVLQNRNPDAVYEFTWTVNAPFRLESSTAGMDVGGTLVTSQDVVTVTGPEAGQATIGVSVRRVDLQNDQESGEDQTMVRFVDAPSITPEAPEIEPGGSVTITATYPGPEAASWRFTLQDPTLGSIDASGVTTNGTVTFESNDNAGSPTIKVEMIFDVDGEEVVVCTDFVVISIGAFPRYDVTFGFITESYDDPRGTGDTKWGAWVSAYVIVPKITGVARYELTFRDGDGAHEVWFADGNGLNEFSVQRAQNPSMDPWWVEITTYFTADKDSEAEALEWVNGSAGLDRLEREFADVWYRLRTYVE